MQGINTGGCSFRFIRILKIQHFSCGSHFCHCRIYVFFFCCCCTTQLFTSAWLIPPEFICMLLNHYFKKKSISCYKYGSLMTSSIHNHFIPFFSPMILYGYLPISFFFVLGTSLFEGLLKSFFFCCFVIKRTWHSSFDFVWHCNTHDHFRPNIPGLTYDPTARWPTEPSVLISFDDSHGNEKYRFH